MHKRLNIEVLEELPPKELGNILLDQFDGDPDVNYIKRIIKAGADINTRDYRKYTPLHLVFSSRPDVDFVKFMIESGADVDVVNNRGQTALHLGVKYKCYEAVLLLIKAGADLEIQDKDGWTALHYAAHYSITMVNILLRAGASKEAKNKKGETPWDMIDDIEFLSPSNISKRKVPKLNPYYIEIKRKTLDELKEINAKELGGLLLSEIQNYYIKESYIRDIIASGADLSIVGVNNRSALHLSMVYNIYEVAKPLIEAGADLDARDNLGYTPLHLATIYDRNDAIYLLLDAGASKEALDNKGNTPWDVAGSTMKNSILELDPNYND